MRHLLIVIFTLVGVATPFVTSVKVGSSAVCSIYEVQAANGSWWLNITGTGFKAGELLYVDVSTPIRTMLGNALYAGSWGTFEDRSLPSVGPGGYIADVYPARRHNELASCAATLKN
jgi:hypothetical protein